MTNLDDLLAVGREDGNVAGADARLVVTDSDDLVEELFNQLGHLWVLWLRRSGGEEELG